MLDGLSLHDFDFIDLGRIRLPSRTVPVTVEVAGVQRSRRHARASRSACITGNGPGRQFQYSTTTIITTTTMTNSLHHHHHGMGIRTHTSAVAGGNSGCLVDRPQPESRQGSCRTIASGGRE